MLGLCSGNTSLASKLPKNSVLRLHKAIVREYLRHFFGMNKVQVLPKRTVAKRTPVSFLAMTIKALVLSVPKDWKDSSKHASKRSMGGRG